MLDLNTAYLILDAASWFMTGLIWFVQVVHYPLFAEVGKEEFVEYAKKHCDRTGLVVVAPMIVQAIFSLIIACHADSQSLLALWTNLALVAIIWIVTALYSVPCHSSLCSKGYDRAVHETLLRANWIRTILWTVCSFIVSSVIHGRLQ